MSERTAGHHPAVEQYLETILELEEAGVVPMRARLVERLGVSAPAVSETVKRLEREGYVTLSSERVLQLTETGREYGSRILRRHRLAEQLLVQVLHVPWSQVHDEACRLEHAISDNLETYLVALLGDPATSPHGLPIPGSANAVDDGPLVALADVRVGQAVVVRRIDEHLQTLTASMAVLEDGQIRPGVTAQVGAAEDGQVSLRVAGAHEPLLVDAAIARGVFVSV